MLFVNVESFKCVYPIYYLMSIFLSAFMLLYSICQDFEMIAFVRFWEVSQCPLRDFIHKSWVKLKFYEMTRTLAK